MDNELFGAIEEYLKQGESLPGIIILIAASFLEYIFPPAPGDTVVLLGAFLAAWANWSAWKVIAATVLGSVAGAWVDTMLGRVLRDYITGKKKSRSTLIGRLWAFLDRPSFRRGIDRITDKYAKYGAGIIFINRFFPGIRALFFVGAGVAYLPMWKVLLYGGLSAAAWNMTLFIAGYSVGKNWDAMLDLFRTYTTIIGVVIGATVVIIILAVLLRFLRKRKKPPETTTTNPH